ncbi:hypothetical protein YPPY46_2608, partial [Yersinia pestis PY-46]
MSPSVTATS